MFPELRFSTHLHVSVRYMEYRSGASAERPVYGYEVFGSAFPNDTSRRRIRSEPANVRGQIHVKFADANLHCCCSSKG
jgi:hypothetical protein